MYTLNGEENGMDKGEPPVSIRFKAMSALASVFAAAVLLFFSGCAHRPAAPLHAVEKVDLARFMGDWYVIAHIPSRPERNAHNAIESYVLAQDGRIETTFRYRNTPDGPLKTMHPVGRVEPGSDNAVWSMQFVWPIRAEYVIAYLDADYRYTIVGRSKRDYVWIMARAPEISDEKYAELRQRVQDMGYALDGLRRVPQAWPERAAWDGAGDRGG